MIHTIVLAPSPDHSTKYVEASQALYSHYQPSYLLTADGASFPHITVIQFDCDSSEIAYQVWVKVCEQMEEQKFEPFVPPFTGISFIEGVGPYTGTTWVELSISRGSETSPIMRIHKAALKALEIFGLNSLNASGNNYRPHLTLARIVMPKQIEMPINSLIENTGFFNLEFGMPDEKWQYAQRIATFPGSAKQP